MAVLSLAQVAQARAQVQAQAVELLDRSQRLWLSGAGSLQELKEFVEAADRHDEALVAASPGTG